MNNHLKKQLEYEALVKLVNKNINNFLSITVKYYLSWNPLYIITHLFAYIIALSARIKGRKGWVHSAYIYKNGHDPRIVEAIGSGVNHDSLYKYFRPEFRGKVEIYIIPANITESQHAKHIQYIEHEALGKKYSIWKAFRAWFDVFKDQKDKSKEVFCTDFKIDGYERLTGKQLVGNNAEITPAESRKLFRKRNYELLYTIDSRKYK